MLDSMPVLQQRILVEDSKHKTRMVEVLQEWEKLRPLRGNIIPSAALDTLANLEVKLRHAVDDGVKLEKAKSVLSLATDLSGEVGAANDALEELSDLREVWKSVIDPFAKLQVIRDMLWSSTTPRKIRLSLEELLKELRSLPNRVRQYDAYTYMLETVKQLVHGNSVLSDLKTDALKQVSIFKLNYSARCTHHTNEYFVLLLQRHWKMIMSRLQISTSLSDVTIGLLWDKGIISRSKELHEILTVAQGEMAIEVFLMDVKDRWMKQELEMVLFQNRIRLIRGWENLFSSLDDHMGGLVLMKSSPYYGNVREFQEEGLLWEERLSKLRAALDVWVDVQRRWIYLEGIFFGSADIKAQLPTEWSRFKNIDGDFAALHRRIAQRPYAMELLNIENLQRNLERLVNLMTLIQRALGEYLDLLEIVGNSGEPAKVLSHVGKMFACLSTATLIDVTPQERNNGLVAKLESMLSKDGEIVPFDDFVEVEIGSSAKKWLHILESRMKSTLAKLLCKSLEESGPVSSTCSNESEKALFLEWCSKFPCQITILATQVNWSMSIDRALSQTNTSEALNNVLRVIDAKLEVMAETVLLDLKPDLRKKYEQLVTELVHERDVTRNLLDENVSSGSDFRWLYHLRFIFSSSNNEIVKKLSINISNASFLYGFEYYGKFSIPFNILFGKLQRFSVYFLPLISRVSGIGERLVQTPLTDRCYLTLTQALQFRLGGEYFLI
jgi:dynein heavy chain 1